MLTSSGFMLNDIYQLGFMQMIVNLVREGRIDLAWDNPVEFKKQIDEEFYDFHQYLVDGYTKEYYHNLNQEERRQLIKRYFYE